VQNNSVKTCLVGEGKLKSQVETYIKKHRLEDSIDIMGFQENPFPYILNSKILVMPSKYEGFGLTAVESMILGKPVVCSGVGGLSDIVDENCGKICMGVEDYIQEITKLLKNKEYYNKKSQLSIEKSTYFTNENKYIDELEKIYNDIKR
jgi:glycosyltransferase involved in cell wall biosynthesis